MDKPFAFRSEGEPLLPNVPENENSADSRSEKTETATHSPEGENNTQEEEKNIPFDKHPRWQERESEWNKRFNDQENRHKTDIESIRKEFGTARRDNANQDKIPAWFGGGADTTANREAWEEYRTREDGRLKQAEERAYQRIEQEKTQKEEQLKKANDFLQSEIATIQTDRTLNPTGKKVDTKKLLEIVLENELIDSQGRWNYKAGWKLLQSQNTATTSANKDRKTIAAATTSSDNKGTEGAPKQYKTSADFQRKKPW